MLHSIRGYMRGWHVKLPGDHWSRLTVRVSGRVGASSLAVFALPHFILSTRALAGGRD